MRTIKFRGNDCTDWIEGDLIHTEKGSVNILRNGSQYQVIPESVGQFTGLHDKNGNEIYEGDIIEYKNNFENGKGKIVFHSSCFIVEWLEQHSSSLSIWTTMNYLQCSSEIEIIGNEFEVRNDNH